MIYLETYFGLYSGIVSDDPTDGKFYVYNMAALTPGDLDDINQGRRLLVPYEAAHADAHYRDVWDGHRFVTPPLTVEEKNTIMEVALERHQAVEKLLKQTQLLEDGTVTLSKERQDMLSQSVDEGIAIIDLAETATHQWELPSNYRFSPPEKAGETVDRIRDRRPT